MREETRHHGARFAVIAMLAPALLTACEPSWQGRTPVTQGAGRSASCANPVTVYGGDTLYSIARRCNVSVRDLIEANRLQPPYVVSPGMSLRLPGGGEYVVQKGDTLLGVARKLKVDFKTLAQVNEKAPPYLLRIGEKLKVPGSFVPPPPSNAPATSVAGAAAAPGAKMTSSGSLVIQSPNAQAGSNQPSAVATPATAAPPPASGKDSSRGAAYAPVGARSTVGASPQARPAEESAPSGETAVAAVPPATSTPPASATERHPAFQPQQVVPPSPPPLVGRGFQWPVKGDVVAEFGPIAKGQNNDGINIAVAKGTPVGAAENGVVVYVGNELKGFGNLLLVKHSDGWMTAYAHLDQIMVRKGDSVRKGQQIATAGASGNVDSPQLHFEIRKGTEAVNPMEFLKG